MIGANVSVTDIIFEKAQALEKRFGVKAVKDKEEAYNRTLQNTGDRSLVTGMKNINRFRLPNGDIADIGHMFGTMDISYHNNNGVNHADVAGWAGDTVDLVSLSDQFGVRSTELEAMIEEITANYFMREGKDLPGEPDEGTFSRTDVYGDLDGYYVMQTLWNQEYEPGLLYSIISNGQSEEQPMTISEVKTIIDGAMSKAKRGGRRGRKSSSREKMVILYEKDFA